jgi:hypothetical protein
VSVPAHVSQSPQVMLVSHSRLRCCSQFAESVRTAGPFADAFQSKHVWPRQSRSEWAHMLFRRSEETLMIGKRAFCIRITFTRMGACARLLPILTRSNSAKHVRANRTANPAEVDGEGLGQVPD